jgi:hypothetical protein
MPLFDIGLTDTAYPYLLFLSQAETERILADHLTANVRALRRLGLDSGNTAVFLDDLTVTSVTDPADAAWPDSSTTWSAGCHRPGSRHEPGRPPCERSLVGSATRPDRSTPY